MPGYRPSSCIGWLWIETASKFVNTQKKGTRTICRHDNLLHESPILPIQLDNHRAGFGLLFSLTELVMYLKNVSDRRVIPTQLDQLSVSLSDRLFVCLWAFCIFQRYLTKRWVVSRTKQRTALWETC